MITYIAYALSILILLWIRQEDRNTDVLAHEYPRLLEYQQRVYDGLEID